ncbi:hypothetical protein [Brevundimonas sp.]|uniref:hypothetical protein n=1 Tax=Brevundimonas sp. TaxID=1871086 RepID=UPI002D71987A|nr:hypothetical protein [Brevundimonas sp.]HYC68164.1 hypothetical protein [Brevundimonas sp.]
MRIAALLLAFALTGLATPAVCQTRETAPRVAVVVVTLDQVRQIQAGYGRSTLASLGDARWGRFTFDEPTVEAALFGSCVDDRPAGRLDYCIRYYLTRAELAADAAPTVVVVFDDHPSGERPAKGPGEMRVACFGRGVVPADPAAQHTWLWPDAARVHGVRDWQRDQDALAACIAAAASEPWTGLREPDVD